MACAPVQTLPPFAAILEDGTVVAWGDVEFGGDCSLVQDQLQGVQQITASSGAFAALLETGAVVTWGNPQYGSDTPFPFFSTLCLPQYLKFGGQTPTVSNKLCFFWGGLLII